MNPRTPRTVAIKLTTKNIAPIVAEAAKRNWTLDHYKDNLEFYSEDGMDVYSVLSVDETSGVIINFNDIPVSKVPEELMPTVPLEQFLELIRKK
jgi:hypothetical protein